MKIHYIQTTNHSRRATALVEKDDTLYVVCERKTEKGRANGTLALLPVETMSEIYTDPRSSRVIVAHKDGWGAIGRTSARGVRRMLEPNAPKGRIRKGAAAALAELRESLTLLESVDVPEAVRDEFKEKKIEQLREKYKVEWDGHSFIEQGAVQIPQVDPDYVKDLPILSVGTFEGTLNGKKISCKLPYHDDEDWSDFRLVGDTSVFTPSVDPEDDDEDDEDTEDDDSEDILTDDEDAEEDLGL